MLDRELGIQYLRLITSSMLGTLIRPGAGHRADKGRDFLVGNSGDEGINSPVPGIHSMS